MTDKPVVSVVMPVYNCEKYIAEAIESVIKQNIPYELLIIDDCSTDNTPDVIRRYLSNERIHCYKNSSNRGVAFSRNRGIKKAIGEYIAFLDADDIWEEDKLRIQLEILIQDGTVLCSTARRLINQNGQGNKIIPVKPRITYRNLLWHNSINCSSVLMKASVAKEFLMEHDDSHEDYIMWLRVLRKYGAASGVNRPLLRYRVSSAGKSGSKLKSARMTFSVYRYMGYGIVLSGFLFISYAINGVMKYLRIKRANF